MNTSYQAATMAASPFGRRAHFATAYHQIGVSTGVSEASSHKLVAMLYDGFNDAVTEARGAMRERRYEAKGRAIGRAINIIGDGLLYDYVLLRLTRANLSNDERLLDECQQLIEPLRSAWKGIAAQVAAVGAVK